MYSVHGEALFRDGKWASDPDVTMLVQAVYDPITGKMRGVLVPTAEDGPVERRVARAAASKAAGNSVALGSTLRDVHRQMIQRRQKHLGAQEKPKEPKDGPCSFALDLELSIKDVNEGKGASSAPLLHGSVRSASCDMEMVLSSASVPADRYYRKAIQYTVVASAVAAAQILLCTWQMEALDPETNAAGVSMLCIGQQAVMDAYMCLLHLTTGIMVEPLLSAFTGVAAVQFCLFSVFELRLLLLAWRARRSSSTNACTMLRGLSDLHARFYGGLLAGIFLTVHLQRFIIPLSVMFHTWWVPQIVHSAMTGTRPALQPSYVIGTSILRLLIPLYVLGCPHNLLKVRPNPMACVALLVLVSVQAALVLAQMRWGPRFFIPAPLLPAKYDYFRPVVNAKGVTRDIETGEADDCVICVHAIDYGCCQHMVAPCGHAFHPECLQQWMAVKLECPTCRRALPPLG